MSFYSRVAAAGALLRSCCRHWVVVPLLLIFINFSANAAHSANAAAQPIASSANASAPVIVVGFVGGFVRDDDIRHSEVQLAQKLRASYPQHLRVAMFQNWHRKAAHQTILRWLDTGDDGNLTNEEKRNAHLILFGHSWGAAAVISLARELKQEKIPVLLTIQVDSIAKPSQNDGVVPANVAYAVNFYQTRGLLHGRRRIRAADPAQTKILGDYFQDYNKPPAECSQYPWLTRHLFQGHTAIECDPLLWSQIEGLIEKYSSAEEKASDLRAGGLPSRRTSAIHHQPVQIPSADSSELRPTID
jgi:predicted transcriptional regulator